MYYFSDEYLEHHGIKGQKWGVRRFQNPDGTLTEAGKKRVAKLHAKVDKTSRANIDKVLNASDKYFLYSGTSKEQKYAKKYVKAVNKWVYESELDNIRKAEIDRGFNYYENELQRNLTIGQLVGGIAGSSAMAGYTASKYKEGRAARKDLRKVYKDRSHLYADPNSSFNKYMGDRFKTSYAPSDPNLLGWNDMKPIRKAYEDLRRR